MPKIIVYSVPSNCRMCEATKRWLEKNAKEHEYEVRNALDYPDLVDKYGIRQAPVVVPENKEAFGGYRPDLLQQIFAGS